MATTAQEWAQKRNWSKAQVKCILGICSRLRDVATKHEKEMIFCIECDCQVVLEFWEDENPISKKDYLKKKGGE